MNSYAVLLILIGFVCFVVAGSHIDSKIEYKKQEKKLEEQMKKMFDKDIFPIMNKNTEYKDRTPLEETPEKFVPKSAFGDGTCMYCRKKIDGMGSNPDDYGLHSKYIDFSDKSVCFRCDVLVTQTNRYISWILSEKPRALEQFRMHAEEIVREYEELKTK